MMSTKGVVVVYRGPLEKMRTAFLIDTFHHLYGEFDFIWIYPVNDGGNRAKYFLSTIAAGKVRKLHVIEDKLTLFFKTRARVRKILKAYEADTLAVIGFSALSYLPGNLSQNIIWCVNGIPEEDTLTNPWNKLLVRFKKWITKNRKVDLILVVSERMKGYIGKMYPGVPLLVAPCSVDTNLYFRHRLPAGQRKYFSYLGSAAPWQNIERISGIWQQIHRLDPSVRFRVVSQDPRSRLLAHNIDPACIEFYSSSNFDEVAAWQAENEVGFLIRDNSLVNQVSYPMKLGEYLASGSWVVISKIDWDLTDFIQQHSCGILIDNNNSDGEIASEILAFRAGKDKNEMDRLTRQAALELDRARWVTITADRIKSNLNT